MGILILVILSILVLVVAALTFWESYFVSADTCTQCRDIPFCIIHIASRRDRESNVRRSLGLATRAGFTPMDKGAVVGNAPMEVTPFLDMTNRPNEMRSTLRPGEVGCFHSHHAAWYLGRDRGVVVCEDDAILDNDCLTRLSEAIDYVSNVLRIEEFVIHGRYSPPRSFTGSCSNRVLTPTLCKVRCPCYNANLYFASAGACNMFCQVGSDPTNWMPVDDFISSLSGCHPTRVVNESISAFAITPQGLHVMKSRSDTQ